LRVEESRFLDFLTLSFVFIDIPDLFRKKAISSQLSAVNLQRVEELRVEESRFLDFLTLSFVFINIPGLFRKKALTFQLSAFNESRS